MKKDNLKKRDTGTRYKKHMILPVLVLLVIASLLYQNSIHAKPRIRLDRSRLSMTAGESRKLKLSGISSKNQKRVTWESSAPGISSVSKKGKVNAKKAGNATVTASFKGIKYRCRVQVDSDSDAVANGNSPQSPEAVTPGTDSYNGFLVDNVYHSQNNGDIHYHAYFPDSYDGRSDHALFITLPGYQGLYFQGVAENLKTEDFAFEAQKYDSKMVILAPQLNDWGEASAGQTIALTEYFLEQYRIDPSKVYIEGYSGDGETLSLVLGKKPELYTAALMCSSQWDGKYEPVINAKTPIYFVIGESDEYYGSDPFKNAYRKLRELYRQQGLSETEIKNLLVLDVKPASYFSGTDVTYQHAGGYLFCRDEDVMGWLFRQ